MRFFLFYFPKPQSILSIFFPLSCPRVSSAPIRTFTLSFPQESSAATLQGQGHQEAERAELSRQR